MSGTQHHEPPVERITGRTVQAFLSDNSTEPDVAVECFVLVPEEGGIPPLRPDGS